MKTRQIIFPEPMKAVLEEVELTDAPLGTGEALIKTEFSVISAGTEGAHFSGLEAQHPGRTAPLTYPIRQTGYGNLGRVLEVGPGVTQIEPGDRILTFSPHSEYVRANVQRFALKVPEEVDGPSGAGLRMAGVSGTLLRRATLRPGDPAVVIGLGLVGNFAAQILQISGVEVLGADVSNFRLGKAQEVGLRRWVNPQRQSLQKVVQEWTQGKGVRLVVEAIGKPELILESIHLLRRNSELVLLGSPRARLNTDVTPFLSRIHLAGLRVVGCLEWLEPIPDSDLYPYSLEDTYQKLLRWLLQGQLKIRPLITHVLSPEQCQEAYLGLQEKKEEYLGVVFDWSQLA